MNRRQFFGRSGVGGVGAAALATLLNPELFAADSEVAPGKGQTDFPAKAKRVIYLFQSGGPAQLDLFDYKPHLLERYKEEVPTSVYPAERKTSMTAGQTSFPVAPSRFKFAQFGPSGAWINREVMPHTAALAHELCIVKSMYTEAINHEPAVIFMQTGSQQVGRPSIGSWISYGLGSPNENLPSFVVLLSKGRADVQNLNMQSWSNGFLPSHHQGVQFRNGADPVLYLNNPPGITRDRRRRELDMLAALDREQKKHWGDTEIDSKINQYEMAYRMQASVPEITDFSDEPDYIFDLYGPDAKKPGTFAANCLLARRLAERDVPFVQLYHMGWDQHGNLPGDIKKMAKSSDQASAALIKDLKQRGLLEDTLVIWGGEFGRTSFSQGKLSKTNYGRDHHPRCFSIWMAGGGVKPGITYGRTDDFGYNVAENGVHVHDLQATILHQLGVNHERFVFKHQGRRYRLTDVHGHVVKGILA